MSRYALTAGCLLVVATGLVWSLAGCGGGQPTPADALRAGPPPNVGRWTVKVGKTARTYAYRAAWGTLDVDSEKQPYIALVFGAAGMPGEKGCLVIVPNPKKTRLGVPVNVAMMSLSLSTKPTDYFASMHTRPPQVTFTARNVRVGGKVSGRLTGILVNADGKKCTLTSCVFKNVLIVPNP